MELKHHKNSNLAHEILWHLISIYKDSFWLPPCGYWTDPYYQHIINNEFPSLNSTTFKQREREVGKAVESIARNSCEKAVKMLPANAISNSVECDERAIWHQCHVHFIWTGRRGVKGIILCWTGCCHGINHRKNIRLRNKS
jgi:hypothetical protein